MFEMSSPPQSANEHVDAALLQINPESESHILVPHAHSGMSALFGVVPSVMVQYGKLLQALKD